jgi:transglutaminase-like putative cysteine protease
MSATYMVTHRTEYVYEDDVTLSYGQLHLLPRELPRQHIVRATVEIDPEPEVYTERVDYFGNYTSYFEIHEPHQKLTVTAMSTVEITDHGVSLLGSGAWEDARDAFTTEVEYMLDSPLVKADERYRAYAQPCFTERRPLIDAVASLCSRIHADFAYRPGSTSVTTPLAEAFARREGVCQDFAHLGIACLRSLGLPARYVSGYLETNAPPGGAKLTGVDGSHAWLSVLIPEAGWLDVDPTNNQFAGERYVVTAFGRDYGDVPPLGGVIYTEGRTEALNVAVDVVAA